MIEKLKLKAKKTEMKRCNKSRDSGLLNRKYAEKGAFSRPFCTNHHSSMCDFSLRIKGTYEFDGCEEKNTIKFDARVEY